MDDLLAEIEEQTSEFHDLIDIQPQEAVGGFSIETIVGALGGTPDPLIDAIKAGKIRGAVGIVGCNRLKVVLRAGRGRTE